MSVRAYRINEIQREQTDSFNLWNDEEFCDLLANISPSFQQDLNVDGSGIVDIAITDLEKVIEQLSPTNNNKEIITTIKQDITWAQAIGDDHILYYCL